MYQQTALILAVFMSIAVLFLYQMKAHQDNRSISESAVSALNDQFQEIKTQLTKGNEIGTKLQNLERRLVESFAEQKSADSSTLKKLENLETLFANISLQNLDNSVSTAELEKWIEDLKGKGKKVFSQNDEDGALEAVFDRIGVTDKVYVEFGVEDCTECNSRYLRSVDRRHVTDGWRYLEWRIVEHMTQGMSLCTSDLSL